MAYEGRKPPGRPSNASKVAAVLERETPSETVEVQISKTQEGPMNMRMVGLYQRLGYDVKEEDHRYIASIPRAEYNRQNFEAQARGLDRVYATSVETAEDNEMKLSKSHGVQRMEPLSRDELAAFLSEDE